MRRSMSLDLPTVLVIAAVIVTSLVEVAMLIYVARLEHSTRNKMDADDAALYLQGRRVEEVLREMRKELLRS